MIDIRQLHIGAHILVNGVRARITGIDIPRDGFVPPWPLIRCMAIVDGDTRYCGGNPESDKIQPIPITPELLTELGFEYRDNTYWERWFKGSFSIEKKENSHYYDYDDVIRLEYLHELENLFSMIYDDELIKDKI